MKHRSLFFVTLFILAAVAIPSGVMAQAAKTERWVCLEAVKPLSGKGNAAFRQTLQTKPDQKPLANTDTYIVECLATDGGQICSTANATTDQTVYGKNNLAEMQTKANYEFVGLYKNDGTTPETNPMKADGTGELGNPEWESHSAHIPRKFMALNYWDPAPVVDGTVGGQQQGTFSFDAAEKNCTLISWDPYGRLFDATTLEPIMNASVTLQMKKGTSFVKVTTDDVPGGNIINPQTTKEDGEFSFVVPDGDYKLVTSPLPLTVVSSIDVNYTKAYSDIYPAVTGEEIQQRGAIQHRDIPVATAATNRAPKLMNYFYEANNSGSLVIQGKASHPLTRVIAKSAKVFAANPNEKVPYRDIATVTADKFGMFSITINQAKLEKTETYDEVFSSLELVKTDLRQPGVASLTFPERAAAFIMSLVRPAEAATAGSSTTIPFEPIPRYLEGYAYDANGKPLTNVTVEVYMTMSNKPYSSVKSDVNGYFKLTSEYLPKYPYELRYKTANGVVVKMAPSKFIAQNAATIAAKKINVYAYKDQKNRTAKEVQVLAQEAAKKLNQGSSAKGTKGTDANGEPETTAAPAVAAAGGVNTGILVALLLGVLLLLIVAGLIALKIKHGHLTETPKL